MASIADSLCSRVFGPEARYNRRRVIGRSLAMGAGMMALAATGSTRAVQAQTNTFTLAANWSPNDIDPHSGYDPDSGFVLAGVDESLIREKPGDGVQLEPWLAESWEANQDYSGVPASQETVTWTGISIFHLECGKAVEGWTEADHFGRIVQQGAIPVATPVS